jgi:hypothetical protein
MTPWRPFWRFFVVFFGAFLSPIFFWRQNGAMALFFGAFFGAIFGAFLSPFWRQKKNGTKLAPVCRHGVFLAPKLLIRLGANFWRQAPF